MATNIADAPAELVKWLAPLTTFQPYPGTDLSSWTGPNFLWSNTAPWGTYSWLVVMGALMAFFMAWGIGANDVANAFATSVGAKTITLWQACIIAAIFEFTGAMVLGGEVARTIAGSITSPSTFQNQPETFAFGMVCALTSAATILAVATYLSKAISTTHSIIGAVLGFGMVFGGPDSIVWNQKTDTFPYRTGVVTVFMSWFIAPICSAILAGLVFFLIRIIVLRRKNSTEWAFWCLPVLAFITVFINVFFVLYKGAGKELKGQVGNLYWDSAGNTAAWVSAVTAAGCALLLVPVVLYLRKRLVRDKAQRAADADAAAAAAAEGGLKDKEEAHDVSTSSQDAEANASKNVFTRSFIAAKKQMTRSLTMDVHEDVKSIEHVAQMHADAEVFDPDTEQVFKYLQVFSACCVAFAHGANDVANAIGPFSGIWYVYNTHNVTSSAPTPAWILALGGAGLVVGLATYGYNIIKVLGVQLAAMTPCRGFSAELGTGMIISLASVYGLPISTTQSIVGAEIGVGLVDGGFRRCGFNWRLFAVTFSAWVVAFVCAALFSASLFAWSVYAPSMNNMDQVINYNAALNGAMLSQINVMNSTNLYRNASGSALFSPELQTELFWLRANLTNVTNIKKNGQINFYNMMNLLQNVTGLYLLQTIPTYNVTA